MYICFMQRKNMNNCLNTQFWFRGRRSRSSPFSFRTAITSLYFDASEDSQSPSVLGLRNCFIDVPDYLGYSSNRTASSSLFVVGIARSVDSSTGVPDYDIVLACTGRALYLVTRLPQRVLAVTLFGILSPEKTQEEGVHGMPSPFWPCSSITVRSVLVGHGPQPRREW